MDTNADYVIASDTDSIYVTFDALIEKVKPNNPIDFLDTIANEKIEPFIDKSYKQLADYVRAYDQKMFMKREVIADKVSGLQRKDTFSTHGMWKVFDTKNLPSRLWVSKRSSLQRAPCREKIKEALKIIMGGSEKELNTFIQDFRKEFINLDPEEIAYPRSVNGLRKFRDSASIYRKGTPMHIKGSLIYNHLIQDKNLNAKYPYIQEGDKIKFIQLRQPNPLGANVISFITKVPKELDIHKYIDYDTQYEKAFVEPLTFITDNIGWNIDRSFGTQTTLEDFFT